MMRNPYAWQPVALLILAVNLAEPVHHAHAESGQLSAGHTAHWFDTEREGEGWSLEILANEQAVGYWFTYDEEGHPRWLIGIGDMIDDRIEFAEMMVTSGGHFGPAFNPDEVTFEVAGSATMQFFDCDSGQLEFELFGQAMTLALERLSRTMLIDCAPPDEAVVAARAHQSGSWYDPAHEREGFTLQWLVTGDALVTWFSYDGDGNQYWMQGVGQEDANGDIHFPQVYATRGPRFGSEYSVDDLELFDWGTLTMTLGCETGVAQYESIIGAFGAGSFDLRRLTIPKGLECPLPDSSPPGFEDASWEVIQTGGPSLSELPAAALGDFIYVGGGLTSLTSSVSEFWRFQPATGQWTRLADMPDRRDHGMMAAHDGRIYFFGGYRNALSGASNNAWRFDPGTNNWTILPAMPGNRVAGGAASLGEHIYVAGGRDTNQTIFRFTPAGNSWHTVHINDAVNRDHSAVVAHEGEIWIMGGRGVLGGGNTDVTIFNPETGTARFGPSMGVARAGFAAASVAGHVIVAGGERFNPPLVLSSVEAYSPETGWQSIAPLPIPVHGQGGASFDNGFYVMLGSLVANDIISISSVQRLVVP